MEMQKAEDGLVGTKARVLNGQFTSTEQKTILQAILKFQKFISTFFDGIDSQRQAIFLET